MNLGLNLGLNLDVALGLNLGLKLVLSLVLAIVLRFDFWAYESQDFLWFLQPWYDFIQANDRFFVLQEDFFNYNPTYVYLLVLWSYLFPQMGALTAVKSIGVVLDLAGAYWIFRWVSRGMNQRSIDRAGSSTTNVTDRTSPAQPPLRSRPAIAAVTLLLTPTVILNSSYWGQCDMGYSMAVLAGLYGLSYGAPRWGLVGLTLGLALKLQAVFTYPLLAVLLLQPRSSLRWSHLWVIPVTYLATLVPAAIAGHPWLHLLTVYWRQFNTYDRLTLNAPSIYQWFPQADYTAFTRLGLLLSASLTLALIWHLVRRYDRFTPPQLLQAALGFNLLLPWLLPKMHDRYLFSAEVLALTLAFFRPRFLPVAIATVVISLGSYAPYLLGREIIPLRGLAIGLGVVGIGVWRDLLGPVSQVNRFQQKTPES
ncbi:MAG: hypothetical protein ACO4CG_07355 [Prochlorothrix sp.]